jgi:hypothetical protein
MADDKRSSSHRKKISEGRKTSTSQRTVKELKTTRRKRRIPNRESGVVVLISRGC